MTNTSGFSVENGEQTYEEVYTASEGVVEKSSNDSDVTICSTTGNLERSRQGRDSQRRPGVDLRVDAPTWTIGRCLPLKGEGTGLCHDPCVDYEFYRRRPKNGSTGLGTSFLRGK